VSVTDSASPDGRHPVAGHSVEEPAGRLGRRAAGPPIAQVSTQTAPTAIPLRPSVRVVVMPGSSILECAPGQGCDRIHVSVIEFMRVCGPRT
jgi:hypothetical protein